jgi:hypothetical protein
MAVAVISHDSSSLYHAAVLDYLHSLFGFVFFFPIASRRPMGNQHTVASASCAAVQPRKCGQNLDGDFVSSPLTLGREKLWPKKLGRLFSSVNREL